ncbi:MAG: class I SAM-dependent methyltransferase [Nocardioides sp.]
MTEALRDASHRTAAFGDLKITFDDRVLEPREWTSMQSHWAAELLGQAPQSRILELCAGAGHIGLLAASLSGASLVCVDIDPVACDFARLNAEAAGLSDRVQVKCVPLEHPLTGRDGAFDLVIADPPWVPREQTDRFPEDPVLAIDGGPDGLDVARDCLVHARAAVSPGADLLIQLGDETQAEDLTLWAAKHGWHRAGLRHGERGVVLHLVTR